MEVVKKEYQERLDEAAKYNIDHFKNGNDQTATIEDVLQQEMEGMGSDTSGPDHH